MFSYRHAFHAGNHADVLKHLALVAVLRHLTQKETPLSVIDTHAGAGLYRLDSEQADISGEASEGILALAGAKPNAAATVDYLDLVRGFNSSGSLRIYPGSPFIVHRLLRADVRDKLRLHELHPTDSRALSANIAQLNAGRQVSVAREDGFEALKALLPPPSRRALVLMDPSYEIKSDYAKVTANLQDALKRFATGVYMVWYPIIPRPEAHELPRRLKTIANRAGKPWVHATLSIGQPERAPAVQHRPGLTASGIFVVNPPHTLRSALQDALPELVTLLGRGRGQGHTLEAGG